MERGKEGMEYKMVVMYSIDIPCLPVKSLVIEGILVNFSGAYLKGSF